MEEAFRGRDDSPRSAVTTGRAGRPPLDFVLPCIDVPIIWQPAEQRAFTSAKLVYEAAHGTLLEEHLSKLYHERVAPFVHHGRKGEPGMKRDISIICAGILAVGVAIWTAWGNPETALQVPRMHAAHHEPDVMFVTERSPYMRDER